MAENTDEPDPRFKLSENDKESLATSGERFKQWLENNKS